MSITDIRVTNPALDEVRNGVTVGLGGRLSTFYNGKQREVAPDIEKMMEYWGKAIQSL